MFQSTTTSFSGAPPKRKPFTWTYTDLKNYRDCRKRHYHYKMAKVIGNMDDAIREPISEELQQGFDFHDAMAERVTKGTPLPPLFVYGEPYARKFVECAQKFAATDPKVGILAEQQWAIDRDYALTDYWGKDRRFPHPWFRTKLDAVILCPAEGIALNWDWKTGKPQALKGYKDDPIQVLLSACVLMIQYPWLQAVRNELVWVQHDMTTRADITREMMPSLWGSVLPEVNDMERAYEQIDYPPKRGFLCKEWCSVESCVHHGKDGRG